VGRAIWENEVIDGEESTEEDLMERHNELLLKVNSLFEEEQVTLSEAIDLCVAVLRNVRYCMNGDVDSFWTSLAANAITAEIIVLENEQMRKKMS
jgi:hypothetical protein